MFLFTTSDPGRDAKAAQLPEAIRRGGPPSPVIEAIREGARATGTGFDYLVKTAQRESALDPAAKARTSSASGLFQFIEQTWLGTFKAEGEKHGLGGLAGAIVERQGHYGVDDPRTRRDILALRHDPKVSAIMAGALAQKNREHLVGTLGREPNASDLYVAHVLGAAGAHTLIRAARETPGQPAAAQFPEAAAANRPIFFDRTGRPRNVVEVYAILAASHAGSATAAPAAAQAGDRAAKVAAAVGGSKEAQAMHGLFGTEGRRGPISETVTRLWTTGPRREQVKLAASTVGFFPRSATDATPADRPEGAASAAVTADGAPDGGGAGSVDLPLPPRRPPHLARVAGTGGAPARSTAPGGR